MENNSKVVKPTFLYIGAAKAGSSWIYEILREHPEVFVPPAKDIQFFDFNYDKGLDWYYSFFTEGKDKAYRGELSHDYFSVEECAQRIHDAVPNVKLMCCLRELGDATESGYRYFVTNFGSGTLDEFLHRPRVIRQYKYYENLKRFYEIFPRENVLVLFYDDLKKDPETFARRIFEFIGADPNFQPPSLLKMVNAAHDPRLKFIAKIVYKFALFLKKRGLANLVGTLKRNKLVNALLYKSASKKAAIMSEEDKKRLREKYKNDYAKLEELIGTPLPSSWYED